MSSHYEAGAQPLVNSGFISPFQRGQSQLDWNSRSKPMIYFNPQSLSYTQKPIASHYESWFFFYMTFSSFLASCLFLFLIFIFVFLRWGLVYSPSWLWTWNSPALVPWVWHWSVCHCACIHISDLLEEWLTPHPAQETKHWHTYMDGMKMPAILGSAEMNI